MSAEKLTAAAAERLADLEVAHALAEGTMASANERSQTASYHRHSESARSKLGAVAEGQRARHAALNLLINGIRQFLSQLPPDAVLEDAVESPTVEPLVPEALQAALAKLRTAIGEQKAELQRVSAAPLPKADLKRLARAHAAELVRKSAPRIDMVKGRFDAKFLDPRADFEWRETPAFVAGMLAWLDPEGFTQRLEAEIDALPDVFSLSSSAKEKRLAEIAAARDRLEREEEALVASAALAGQDVLRRADASPAAVLGVRIAKRAAKAA
jgi:hypothetical protein